MTARIQARKRIGLSRVCADCNAPARRFDAALEVRLRRIEIGSRRRLGVHVHERSACLNREPDVLLADEVERLLVGVRHPSDTRLSPDGV